MKWLFILSFVFSGVLPLQMYSNPAQADPKEEVEKVIIDFFDAMRDSDSSAMQAMLTQEATLHTVVVSEEGNTMLRETEIRDFMSNVAEAPAGALDEQLTSFTAHVDGSLATAWMDYSFYYNEEFSHCGVNTMNLILTDTGWKIFSIVDTRRGEGC